MSEERWNDAIRCYEDVLQSLIELSDELGIARIQLRIGQMHEQSGRPTEAVENYTLVEQAAARLRDRQLEATALHRLGHVLRMNSPDQAREMFRRSLELGAPDQEANSLSLAMIGQIDFTAGDQRGGLETMLKAVNSMPDETPSRDHLVEHIVYFGGKMERDEYVQLVERHTLDESLSLRLRSSP
ncbi:MAG: tetratricopeptide repeat protein [Planctomycetaceae bacterium]|nr:tetratricopeptide repeat protein [Planctomycetaceae bacterium]